MTQFFNERAGHFIVANVDRNNASRKICNARWMESNQSNQINYFIVRLKVDQRAGQLSLPHLGITKTETHN